MKHAKILFFAAYFIFIAVSLPLSFNPGREIGVNFYVFSSEMLKLLPCAFILIGLFEVWVKKESVEKHMGRDAGLKGHLWVILLASTTVGGLYVAFPVARSLYGKGARLEVIFTYLGAAAVCRIPMTIFEASFMGIGFTLVRFSVSLPLIVASSVLLGRYLEKRNYSLRAGA